MRIAIDCDAIGRNRSGNETYLRGMISALQQIARVDDELLLLGGDPVAIQPLVGGATTWVPHPRGLRGDLTMGRRMTALGAHVAVATYNRPLAFSGPTATAVHDVAFRRVPETYPRRLRARIALSVARSVRTSTRIVTISEFSRRELLECYPALRPERVVVTPCAAEDVFFADPPGAAARVRAELGLPERFVLSVGNLQPRKNLERLAAAVAMTGQPLVVTGQPTWRAGDVLTALRDSHVRWLGHVPQGQLAALYRACSAFAYVSLYEGFGLPVVEAMASGAPVVTSNTTALAEVAGDAAVTVDPLSVDDIARGLESVLSDRVRADETARRGRRRAAEYSWESSASILLAELRRIT